MNFPPFWARGQSGNFFVWRWSAKSLTDAQTLANQAAQQLAERFRAGEGFSPKQGGYYPNRPFREQILQELKNPAGEIAAVITRNSYGCQVLNTAKVMFVDIDLPEPKPVGLIQRLLGKKEPLSSSENLAAALTRIESWTRQHPEWGWRIYQTRAGLRLLATQALVETSSPIASEIFEALGADPLYRHLCLAQKCYRARLTPKPWRCGLQRKPDRWPFLDAKAERRFQKWEEQYRSFSGSWATCQLIRSLGNPAVHPEIQPIIKLHDTATRVGEASLQLA